MRSFFEPVPKDRCVLQCMAAARALTAMRLMDKYPQSAALWQHHAALAYAQANS